MKRWVGSTEPQSSDSPKLYPSERMVEESPQVVRLQLLCGQTITEPKGQTVADLHNQTQLGKLPVSSRETSQK